MEWLPACISTLAFVLLQSAAIVACVGDCTFTLIEQRIHLQGKIDFEFRTNKSA